MGGAQPQRTDGREPWVVPLRGGRAAFASPARTRDLVSVLGADERRPGRGPHAWREAIQARRSALILAPDRETAVTYALAWSLDLSKIRLGTDVSSNRRRELAAELDAASIRERPWHSRG